MVTKASYGVQSTAKVISAWPRLSSKGTTTYEIQLHADGVLTCNCPGWVTRRTRDCKHVKDLLFKAQSIIRGDAPAEFEHTTLYVPKTKTQILPANKRGRFIQVMEEEV